MTDNADSPNDIFDAEHCWNRIGVWGKSEPRCDRLKELTHCRNCEVYRQAGRQIFERDISKNYLEHWAKIFAANNDQDTESYQSLVVFRLVDQWFALPSAALTEIARFQGMHKIPHFNRPHILGLVNLHGRIALCYSLESMLGLTKGTSAPSSARSMLQVRRQLVVNINGEEFIFLVDEITGVNRYADSDLCAVPASDTALDAGLATGMIVEADKTVYVLDPQAVVQSERGKAHV